MGAQKTIIHLMYDDDIVASDYFVQSLAVWSAWLAVHLKNSLYSKLFLTKAAPD
jgi:hypothetical protein